MLIRTAGERFCNSSSGSKSMHVPGVPLQTRTRLYLCLQSGTLLLQMSVHISVHTSDLQTISLLETCKELWSSYCYPRSCHRIARIHYTDSGSRVPPNTMSKNTQSSSSLCSGVLLSILHIEEVVSSFTSNLFWTQ